MAQNDPTVTVNPPARQVKPEPGTGADTAGAIDNPPAQQVKALPDATLTPVFTLNQEQAAQAKIDVGALPANPPARQVRPLPA